MQGHILVPSAPRGLKEPLAGPYPTPYAPRGPSGPLQCPAMPRTPRGPSLGQTRVLMHACMHSLGGPLQVR